MLSKLIEMAELLEPLRDWELTAIPEWGGVVVQLNDGTGAFLSNDQARSLAMALLDKIRLPDGSVPRVH